MSWNVAGRMRVLAEQAERLLGLEWREQGLSDHAPLVAELAR